MAKAKRKLRDVVRTLNNQTQQRMVELLDEELAAGRQAGRWTHVTRLEHLKSFVASGRRPPRVRQKTLAAIAVVANDLVRRGEFPVGALVCGYELRKKG